MAKKRGLGRNLDALLGGTQVATSTPVQQPALKDNPVTKALIRSAIDQKVEGKIFSLLPIEQLTPGTYQPRQHMDKEALTALSESIRAQGIIQPILVKRRDETTYEIIAGERRWRAAQLAGLDKVPVIVETKNNESTLIMALVENIQREDLNPLEMAQALKRMATEFSMSHEKIAQVIGKGRTTVSNFIRILDCHPQVQEWLQAGRLEMGHVKALLGLPASEQVRVGQKIVKAGLTVRQGERLIRQEKTGTSSETAPPTDPHIRSLERDLGDRLGAKVRVRQDKSGKAGQLLVHYDSLDHLEGILERIK